MLHIIAKVIQLRYLGRVLHSRRRENHLKILTLTLFQKARLPLNNIPTVNNSAQEGAKSLK